MAENIKLPKNIRQIGTPGDKQKVYIEDYVYTYLHSFLKEKYQDDTLKAAVILGEHHKKDGATYAFVKGAVSCDFSLLHEEMSEELSQTIRNYFPGWDMLGWYVSSQGVDSHIQSEIKHHYAGCEAHSPQYLIYEDELERDIQVFAWEQNALHYLNGYYIYYEKNPRMQEFLISEKGGRPQEMPTDRSAVITPPQEDSYRSSVSKSFADMREIMQEDKHTEQERTRKKQAAEGKNKKPQRVMYAACAAILILLAAMGVSQMGNYQNLKQLQETISNTIIPVRSQDTPQDPLSEETPEESNSSSGAEETSEPTAGAEEISEPTAGVEETFEPSAGVEEVSEPTSNIEETQEQLPVMQEAPEDDLTNQSALAEYYTVKKGDSLFSISRAIYENENMVGPICELNGITNLNLIIEGQTLKLP